MPKTSKGYLPETRTKVLLECLLKLFSNSLDIESDLLEKLSREIIIRIPENQNNCLQVETRLDYLHELVVAAHVSNQISLSIEGHPDGLFNSYNDLRDTIDHLKKLGILSETHTRNKNNGERLFIFRLSFTEDIKINPHEAIVQVFAQTKFLWEKYRKTTSQIDHTHSKKEKIAKIKIADSSLIVIKSILMTWQLEKILTNIGIESLYIPYAWSDKILEDLEIGRLDIAIYNRQRTEKYILEKDFSKIDIFCDICKSMNGNNFYILSQDIALKSELRHQSFLESCRGATVILPLNSDIHTNLSKVAKYYDPIDFHNNNIKLLDNTKNIGLEAFDLNNNALLLCGQNTRYQAIYRGGFHEIIQTSDLSPDEQKIFNYNAVNSLIIRKSLLEDINVFRLQEIFNEAMLNFRLAWSDNSLYSYWISELAGQINQQVASTSEAEFIIEKILHETYKFRNTSS